VTASISQQLAAFATTLRREDLPLPVVERVRSLVLQGLTSAAAGLAHPAARRIVELIRDDERGVDHGARILGDGATVTRGGAAFAGAELIHRGARLDVFHMLTHPGTTILPAAFAAADGRRRTGADLIAALAAAYEVHARLAEYRIPAVQARGFRSSPVFGTMGAVIASARLAGLGEAATTRAIALAVEMASGNLEGARAGSDSFTIHEPTAARNAIFATSLAEAGVDGADSAIDGPAGFFHAFVGRADGTSERAFTDGQRAASAAAVTGDLGLTWQLLDTGVRVYDVAGYHVPVIELARSLSVDAGIPAAEIDRVEIELNEHELTYPSPAFARSPAAQGPGSAAYYAAFTILAGGYPLGRPRPRGGRLTGDEPVGITDLMAKVDVQGSASRPILTPRMTIVGRDGTTVIGTATGDELALDFATLTARLGELASAGAVSGAWFERLVAAARGLAELETVEELITLSATSGG
jgi:2-methylcitrate dehydratase PrpD